MATLHYSSRECDCKNIVNGTPIADDVLKSGNIGEAYATEQKDISGYTFKEVNQRIRSIYRSTANCDLCL